MSQEFQNLYFEANRAGRIAGDACIPQPMVVVQGDLMGKPLPGAVREVVSGGVCGFAWIKVAPANCRFANWLKKQGLARAAYGGGVQIWVSLYGQSMECKEAYAYAFADVLKAALPEVSIYAQSRMD